MSDFFLTFYIYICLIFLWKQFITEKKTGELTQIHIASLKYLHLCHKYNKLSKNAA